MINQTNQIVCFDQTLNVSGDTSFLTIRAVSFESGKKLHISPPILFYRGVSDVAASFGHGFHGAPKGFYSGNLTQSVYWRRASKARGDEMANFVAVP